MRRNCPRYRDRPRKAKALDLDAEDLEVDLAQAPFCRDAPEVLSVWGSDEPRSRHHIFSPYGTALHLDRFGDDSGLCQGFQPPAQTRTTFAGERDLAEE